MITQAFLVGLALAMCAKSAVGDAELTMLSDSRARCMDGTLSGYYFNPATSSDAKDSWVLNLEGGGECTTRERCYPALNGPLGSSKYFSKTHSFGYYATEDPKTNPDFYDWNHVFLPYCSQDLWTGTVTTPKNTSSNDTTFGLYFSGHLVFDAVLDALDSKGLKDAKRIILSGESAGGIGVWPNLDYLAERYPNADVVGAPIAGLYYFADPYQGPNHTQSDLADFREPAWPQHAQLWHSFVDQDCAKAHPTWFCVLANNSLPYISSRVFVTQSFTDQVVLLAHDWVPPSFLPHDETWQYAGQWAHNMTVASSPIVESNGKRGAVFGAACLIHTSFSPTSPIIDNLNFIQAFGDWYFDRVSPDKVNHIDSCGIFCNPTCNQPPN